MQSPKTKENPRVTAFQRMTPRASRRHSNAAVVASGLTIRVRAGARLAAGQHGIVRGRSHRNNAGGN